MLLISSEDSETSVIAWYDNTSQKIMYFTKAENVYLDDDSSYMFSKLKNLKSIDMNQFKTDHVTNMERMFENSVSYSLD
jgi:surface protein